jgi:hypothetical protein
MNDRLSLHSRGDEERVASDDLLHDPGLNQRLVTCSAHIGDGYIIGREALPRDGRTIDDMNHISSRLQAKDEEERESSEREGET